MITPRRFLIRSRDNLAQILAEGVVWSNGGVSTVRHPCRWFKDSRGLALALPEELGLPTPQNLAQLENLAAAVWGELDWLDKSEEEIAAAAAQAQAKIDEAWRDAQVDMHKILFAARKLDWRDPVAVAQEQRTSRGLDEVSGNEPAPEEDSELPFVGYRVAQAAPGDFLISGDFSAQQAAQDEEDIDTLKSWWPHRTLTVHIPEPSRLLSTLLLGHDPWAEVIVGKDTTINGMLGDLVFRPYGPSSSEPVPVPAEGAAEPVDPPQGPAEQPIQS
jgi:hypothetical protein